MNGRPTAQTAKDWLPVAAQIGDDIRDRMTLHVAHTQRQALCELSVHIGPQVNAPAPAWWDHTRAEVCIDTRVGMPNDRAETVAYSDPTWRAEHLRVVGLVEHEIGHVLHTPKDALREWDDAGGATLRVFGQHLEETRMEAAVLRTGGDALALRAVANELILREFDTNMARMSPRWANALRLAVILGRSEKHGGSTPDNELRDYREAFAELLGSDTVAALEHELHGWNATDRDDFPHGSKLAPMLERWQRIVGEDPEQESGNGDGDKSGGEPTEGQGQPEPIESREKATQAAESKRQEQAAERIAEQLIERLDDAARAARQAAREKAEKAERIDRQTLDESVKGHGVGQDSGRAQVMLEPVTPEVRRLATQLAKDFRRIATPQLRRTTQTNELPPGRLRGRGAVQRAAQSHAGMIPTAHPFRTTKRKRTHAPPPVIGIILDVSGSMDQARRPVAEVGYALAEAGRVVQAKTAMVAMGSVALLMDHDPRNVAIYNGVGGAEDFRAAFGIIDSRLHLSDRTSAGTRLLVVVTDARYGLDGAVETAAACERELPHRGCGVLWIAPTHNRLRINARHVYYGHDPKGIAQAIERALQSVRGGMA